MYEETVLIKLRRDYEKDEVVMFALNKIKEQEVEIGKLKSYIFELEEGSAEFKELEEYKERCEKLKTAVNTLKVENKNLIYNRINVKEAESRIKAELRKNLKLSKNELKEFGLHALSKENESLKKEKAKLVRWAERLKETIKELKGE